MIKKNREYKKDGNNMMQQFHLLYASDREEDIRRMKQMMAGTGIEIFSPYEVGARVHVKTKSLDPVENARTKAMAYYKKMGSPSFAVESGLYIEGLPEEKQPAAQYRKYRGIRLSDEDCIDYYCSLANRLGKPVKAMFLSAICLVVTEEEIFQSNADALSASPFYLATKVHPKRVSRQPFASLAINLDDGRYWADDPEHILTWKLTNAYRDFLVGNTKRFWKAHAIDSI